MYDQASEGKSDSFNLAVPLEGKAPAGVDRALTELHAELTMLGKSLDNLHERLNPILVSRDSENSRNDSEPTPEMSVVQHSIHEATLDIRFSSARIGDIIRSLDI